MDLPSSIPFSGAQGDGRATGDISAMKGDTENNPDLNGNSSVESGQSAANTEYIDSSETLLASLYEDLRKLATHQMASQTEGHTLQPTALVHEAWLRLSRNEGREWNDGAHFLAAAAQAMRQILVDRARRKKRIRHGGDQVRVQFGELTVAASDPDDTVLQLDDALNQLAKIAPEQARLVELRYFCGLTVEEASMAMGISRATSNRYWAFARAWLHLQLSSSA